MGDVRDAKFTGKGSLKGHCDNRMFYEMLRPARERLKKQNPKEIAIKSKVVYKEENNLFEIKTLNQIVRLSVPEYEFDTDISQWHQILILHYLANADGAEVPFQQVPFAKLKDGFIRGTKFDSDTELELQKFLSGKTAEEIQQICQRMGADFQDDRADLCAVFWFLPNYPVWLRIWFGDEEFESVGKFMVSESSDHYLTIEDAVTVGTLLLELLRYAACEQ